MGPIRCCIFCNSEERIIIIMSISIVIPTFNDDYYLRKLIDDILMQDYSHTDIEVIIIEAGENKKQEIEGLFKDQLINIKYKYVKNLGRNKSLNLGFSLSVCDLIVRLDARTHIEKNYLSKLNFLSKNTNCINVGGVKVPIGETPLQKLIARVMSNPLCLGGAKFRKRSFNGYADTVYLGCYKRKKFINNFVFEEGLERISEDADLNYQLIKNGEKIFVSSDIKAYYYCRESISKFVKLMFNYGVSRGLFICKNKTVTAFRQLLLPAALFVLVLSLFLSLFKIDFFIITITLASIYITTMILAAVYIARYNLKFFHKALCSLIGTHIAWTLGFYYSLILFIKYRS